MLNKILPTVFSLVFLCQINAENPFRPDAILVNGEDTPSTLFFDLNSCLSNSGIPGSASDYSEFTAMATNNSECAEIALDGVSLYRLNSDVNMHSCSPGVDDSNAMCVGISTSCDYVSGDDKAVRFDVIVTPVNGANATLQKLSFFENAPETFSWIDGPSGPNNFPTFYGIRVLANGEVLFEESGIETENEWNLEEFDFSENPLFTVSETTTFNFELVPYCPIGNGASVAAWDLDNIQVDAGCLPVEGGEIELEGGGTELEICAGDGINDPMTINIEGVIGESSSWIITDADYNILDLPDVPPADLEGAGAGICIIWHLSYNGDITGLAIGENTENLEGCYDLSNPITITREGVNGGELATLEGETELSLCVGDGQSDSFDVMLTDKEGQNMAWVITDSDGIILDLPDNPPFDLEGAGTGVCLIYGLCYADGLEGLEPGMKTSELIGCFDFSNPIVVTRNEAAGGNLTTGDGEVEIDICVGDGNSDAFDIELTEQIGQNSAWLITDPEGNILDLPTAPPFDLEGAGSGTCLIWHLSYSDGLEGAEVGSNADNLEGCFSLSNAITVNRTEVNGGSLATTDGETNLIICADDGESDAFDTDLSGAIGSNMSWVITDNQGIILDLPDAGPFDLEGSGAGVCLLWNISYEDGLEGAEIGMNANNLIGCHDLSNPITVTRLVGDNCDLIICDAEGGVISLPDSSTSITLCADDMLEDLIEPSVIDNEGENFQWVVTDTDANILALPDALPINFEGAEAGICLIWHLSYNNGLEGLEVDNNIASLSGCFDLSNAITVTRVVGEDCEGLNCDVDGGVLIFDDGSTNMTICADDSIPDPLDVILANDIGENSGWVITSVGGTILGLPDGPPFDLDGGEPGVCLIWHISYDGDITGLEVDSSTNNLGGCFDLSNPISVTRVTGPNCDNLGCEAQGGDIETTDGLTELEICADDGISDEFDVILTNNNGTNSQWVITNASAIIVGLPDGPPFDLEGAGEGICLIWHLSYEDGLTGLAIDSSALDLEGCFDLSNAITVTRYVGGNCAQIGCEAEGGSISYPDSTTNIFQVCSGDGIDDITDVNLSGNQGTNATWVITDNVGNILEFPTAPPFNFEGATTGICLIWHLSYEDGLEGAEVGLNTNDLEGCFSLSNSLTVIRNQVGGGDLTFDDGSTSIEICVGDGMPDSLNVSLSNAIGSSMQWIITDSDLNILSLPDTFPIDFESVDTGTCLIWNVSYANELVGLEIGENAANLSGCYDLSNAIEVVRLSGTDCDGGEPNGLNLPDIIFHYGPNPTSGILNVSFERLPGKSAKVYIMDHTGKQIKDKYSKDGKPVSFNVEELRNGLYLIMVESNTRIEVKKFIKIK